MTIPRTLAPFAVALLGVSIVACSTIDEGGTSTSATSGPYIPPPPHDEGDDGADETGGGMAAGPEDFDYCSLSPEGTHALLGWQITCTASDAARFFTNPFDSTYLEIEDVSGPFGNICCGGISPVSEADAGCQQLCMQHICEAARVQHVAWALDVSNDGMGGDCLDVTANCGFDFALCMTGEFHEQHASPGALFSYMMQASCEAVHDQGVSPYHQSEPHWDWVQIPNDPTDDVAPLCAPIPEPEPGPPEHVPENELGEEPGTSVTVQWSVGGSPVHREQSLDAQVDLAYAVNPCHSGDCIVISQLHVTVPDGSYQGMALENIHLVVEHASAETLLSASGTFALGAGALRATLSFSVEGVPLVLTGSNDDVVYGLALPHADAMTLNNLRFGFDDGLVDAQLELNINGTYIRRAPDAFIKVVDAPVDCAQPVTFEAASQDLDGDPLTHVWWVPPWFLGTGRLLEATLPTGTYRVYLTSLELSGRADSAALQYVRACR